MSTTRKSISLPSDTYALDTPEVKEMQAVKKRDETTRENLSLIDAAGAPAAGSIIFTTIVAAMIDGFGASPDLAPTLITAGLLASVSSTLSVRLSKRSHQKRWVQELIDKEGYTAHWENSRKVKDFYVTGKQEVVPITNGKGVVEACAVVVKNSATLLKILPAENTWDDLLVSVARHYNLEEPVKMSFSKPSHQIGLNRNDLSVESRIQEAEMRLMNAAEKIKIAQAELQEARYQQKMKQAF